jgi:hypothetical protein
LDFEVLEHMRLDLPIPSIIPPGNFFPVHLVSRHDVAAVVTNWLPTRISSFEMGSNSCREYAPRCSTVAHHLSGLSQSSQILRVKRAQGGCDSGPNSNDSFFDAWAEQRDPKLAANK